MGGRRAAPQAHSLNVMCHVPAGTPTVPHARGGRSGVLASRVAGSPPRRDKPGVEGPCPSPNRARVGQPGRTPTSAFIVGSPSAPWNPPRPHSRHHQAPGSERPTRAKVVQTTPRAAPTGTSRTMGIAWGEARSGEIGPVRGCWRPPWPRPVRGPRAGTPKARDGSPAMTDRVGGWGRKWLWTHGQQQKFRQR